MEHESVLVMGASPKADRYSNIATYMLLQYGHKPVCFGKRVGEIKGIKIEQEFPENAKIDTVTMYLNEQNQKEYEDRIIALHPKRVIFNPGAENLNFQERLEENGIEAEEACTLVLLRTGQY